MRCELPMALIAVALLIGCPKTGTTTSGDPCARSIEGDLATARTRLDKGKPDQAALYIDALVGCDRALASPRFLEVALDVYEEAGRLNEAWSVGAVGMQQLDEAEPTRARLADRISAFEAAYAVIVSPRDGRDGLEIEHQGAVTDDGTKLQLKAVRSGRGVLLDGGHRGYWLYPGSYVIQGDAVALVAGQRYEDPRP